MAYQDMMGNWIGAPEGDDPAGQQLGRLSNIQSAQSPAIGANAAAYADPFAPRRQKYQDQLDLLMSNPGSQDTSPYYKYLMDTQMNQVQARNAATGNLRSGAGAMALQDRSAGVASQAYGQRAGILSKLAGVDSSSPAAAGISYGNFVARSQNQAQQAIAQRNAPGANRGGGPNTGLPTGNIGNVGAYSNPTQQVSSGGAYSPGGGYSGGGFAGFAGSNGGGGSFDGNGNYVPGMYDGGTGGFARTDGGGGGGWGNVSSGGAGDSLGNQWYQGAGNGASGNIGDIGNPQQDPFGDEYWSQFDFGEGE